MSRRGITIGSLILRLHLFDTPAEEIRRALSPPWPRTIRRLYELEALSDEEIRPDEGSVSVGAAISALDTLLHHRLSLIAWGVSSLERLGWEMHLDGSDILASKVVTREVAMEELENEGILGPLTKVCELDHNGLPVLVSRWELR